MAVIKTIKWIQLAELRDHRDNTAWELIKCYTLSQISFMDWIDTRTVQTNGKKYLPVRVDSWPSWEKFRRGKQAKPYRVMYIRLDEIKALYNKRTGNKLVVELK